MRDDNRRIPVRLWAALCWIAVWQLAAMAIGRELLLPTPLQVVARLFELVQTAQFWTSVGGSLLRIACGFFSAVLLGVLFAGLASRFTWAEALISPVMLTFKTVPVASFIILALIWFSSRNLAILISFMMVLPVIYINVLGGIRSVDPQLDEMARVFRLPLSRRIRCVLLPQVMPAFRNGITLGLGLCWKSGVAAEVIGMPRGSIGERLQQAKVYLETPDVFAWTLVIVAVSLLFERLVLLLVKAAEHRLERV
ncbi:MAG: ABC transporter permease subunit [Clostridia bacterium]|nr:ABC transporter permease subunit [Clostridia bacterium]